jgi:hypothetical protein
MSKLVTVVLILQNQHTYSVVGVRPPKALNAQLGPYVDNPTVFGSSSVPGVTKVPLERVPAGGRRDLLMP